MVRNVIGGGRLVRPQVLWDGLRGDWAVINCEETTEYFFKNVQTRFAAPNIKEMNGDEVGGESINKMRAIVPNTSDEGIGFVRSSRERNNRGVGMNEGINDEVESDYGKVGIEYPPLKVMFTPNLEVRRLLRVDGNNRPVVTSTGGKDPYTQGAHCEHIVRTDNM